MNTKKLTVPLAAFALVLSAGGGIVAAAHADTVATTATTALASAKDGFQHQKPAAVGKVTAVSGTTITLTDERSGTTYTVDAASATVKKHEAPTQGSAPTAPTTISVSDIVVGDMIAVQGTVNGSSITATKIDDGMMPHGRGMGDHGIHGTVTAVNGTILTVKSENGTTYTVTADSATASKMQTISVSDISVGDSIGVDGTVSGTSVTAKHLMDGIPPMGHQGGTTTK